MDFEPNERDLIVRLLKRFGTSVAKDSSYEPNDVAHPLMLAITNQVLRKFDELSIEPQVKS